jgi:hypothetical protein
MRHHGNITKIQRQTSPKSLEPARQSATLTKLERPIASFATNLIVANAMATMAEIAARRAPTPAAILQAFDTLAAAATNDVERCALGAQKLAFMKANGIR